MVARTSFIVAFSLTSLGDDLGAPAPLVEAALGEVRGPHPDTVAHRPLWMAKRASRSSAKQATAAELAPVGVLEAAGRRPGRVEGWGRLWIRQLVSSAWPTSARSSPRRPPPRSWPTSTPSRSDSRLPTPRCSRCAFARRRRWPWRRAGPPWPELARWTEEHPFAAFPRNLPGAPGHRSPVARGHPQIVTEAQLHATCCIPAITATNVPAVVKRLLAVENRDDNVTRCPRLRRTSTLSPTRAPAMKSKTVDTTPI